ncbi:MAG: putative lipid II flippase FtsW [Betaproteobacteria bacterium]|jgi:cell division protein FtsW|nr:putative lipid II flippase FtsW [Betaproteobacteria bacterium]MBK9783491.1 putative lipid II flippase FtsW [Candidatus Dechloromonas phosphorivorans]
MMIGALDAPRRQLAEIDYALLWSVLMLLFAGLVMVYSASIAIAEAGRFTNHQPAYYLVRHGVFLCIGLVAAGVAFQIPLSLWQKYAPYLFMAGVFMLALVLIPGVGKDVNGARRWLSFGFANLQPSELMKMFAVLYAADYTVRKINVMHDLKQAFAPLFGAMVIVGILLLKEPDFGAFVVIISIAMGILFLGGLKARLFVMLIVGLLFAFAVMIIVSPYRRDRVFGFMDPWADAYGRGYQLSHSLIAFGRGELFGVGLGGSVEKLFYLPEAHTDFLLAVIAEEMGFFGVLAVIALFALIVQRAFAIGRQCVQLDRLYPALVAMGMGIWIGVQSFINMGVNMGLLPTKGLTLPLMSFGGSGILANCVALAILLRVDWENRQLMRGGKV